MLDREKMDVERATVVLEDLHRKMCEGDPMPLPMARTIGEEAADLKLSPGAVVIQIVQRVLDIDAANTPRRRALFYFFARMWWRVEVARRNGEPVKLRPAMRGEAQAQEYLAEVAQTLRDVSVASEIGRSVTKAMIRGQGASELIGLPSETGQSRQQRKEKGS